MSIVEIELGASSQKQTIVAKALGNCQKQAVEATINSTKTIVIIINNIRTAKSVEAECINKTK